MNKNLDSFSVAKAEAQQEVIIQSDKQSEINDVIYAEGNVSVVYRGKLLKADTLIYDRLNKTISAKWNISLDLGEQFFKVEELDSTEGRYKIIFDDEVKSLWKKHFDLIKSQKDASRTKAIEIFPKISSILSKKKDANKADAILIASYFWETFNNK